jgi:transposase
LTSSYPRCPSTYAVSTRNNIDPIFLVVDGHSIHKAKLVSEYVASTNGMLELHFLTPYSPQLNPDEQVWKSVKERVAKQKPLDKVSLRRLIQGALERLQTLPEIVRGFFWASGLRSYNMNSRRLLLSRRF